MFKSILTINERQSRSGTEILRLIFLAFGYAHCYTSYLQYIMGKELSNKSSTNKYITTNQNIINKMSAT